MDRFDARQFTLNSYPTSIFHLNQFILWWRKGNQRQQNSQDPSFTFRIHSTAAEAAAMRDDLRWAETPSSIAAHNTDINSDSDDCKVSGGKNCEIVPVCAMKRPFELQISISLFSWIYTHRLNRLICYMNEFWRKVKAHRSETNRLQLFEVRSFDLRTEILLALVLLAIVPDSRCRARPPCMRRPSPRSASARTATCARFYSVTTFTVKPREINQWQQRKNLFFRAKIRETRETSLAGWGAAPTAAPSPRVASIVSLAQSGALASAHA